MAVLRKYRLDILGANSNLNKVYEGFNKDTEFTKVNPVKLLTSGKIDTSDIGKTVYLSNSISSCQEWYIADINHDGTSGTVDLISKYNLNPSGVAFSTSTHNAHYANMRYPNFAFRYWLNEDLHNGFASNVQLAMKDMQTPYEQCSYAGDGNYTPQSIQYVSEKVRCPSIAELGVTDMNKPSLYIQEGTIYPIFTQIKDGTIASPYYTSNSLITNADGSSVYFYWTRSMVPSYYSRYCPGPALMRDRESSGQAYIYYSGGSSSSGVDSWSTNCPRGNGAVTMYYGSTQYYVGIRGIIRF